MPLVLGCILIWHKLTIVELSMSKKTFRKVHLWLSVPFGIIIAIICFSGAMLVFEQEITQAANSDFYKVDANGRKPIPIDSLANAVQATLPDSVEVTGAVVSASPSEAYRFNLSKPRRASIVVDQYTGEIRGKVKRAPFFDVMFRLHRWLLNPPAKEGIAWGKMIVGVSTLMFVFVLISGIVIWWPRTKKALVNSLKINASHGWRRFWHGLHVAGGMYALILLLAMALTGLTWSFGWYRTGFYKVFGVEMQQNGPQHGEKSNGKPDRREKAGKKSREKWDGNTGASAKEEKKGQFVNWQKAFDDLSGKYSSYKSITIGDGTASVSLGGLGNSRASDRYKFDKESGNISDTQLYSDSKRDGKIRGWIYSVHTGSWGGMFTRILTFLAALLGASLPLTGYYLWIKRLNAKSRRK